MTFRPERDQAYFEELSRGHFPGWIGVVVTEVAEGLVRAELRLRPEHFAPNGFLHAGAIVTLADTAAGYGCLAHLPDDAVGFTTLEVKTNFLRAARDGVICCEARSVHLGRTTHVWDASVVDEDGRSVALFRCTQLVLYA
jgi:1,4-dihydroxy-2-naphthoyl-CoA hydrolase